MTQTFANKCQMEIIYILFKQSYLMLHSLKVASWINIPKKKYCASKMLHGSVTCTAITFQMFTLLSLLEATLGKVCITKYQSGYIKLQSPSK